MEILMFHNWKTYFFYDISQYPTLVFNCNWPIKDPFTCLFRPQNYLIKNKFFRGIRLAVLHNFNTQVEHIFKKSSVPSNINKEFCLKNLNFSEQNLIILVSLDRWAICRARQTVCCVIISFKKLLQNSTKKSVSNLLAQRSNPSKLSIVISVLSVYINLQLRKCTNWSNSPKKQFSICRNITPIKTAFYLYKDKNVIIILLCINLLEYLLQGCLNIFKEVRNVP